MQRFVAYDGTVHPVRDGYLIFPDGWTQAGEDDALAAWKAVTPPPWDSRPDTLAAYKAAFEASKQAELLTAEQREYLEAWTNRGNINSALAWIAPHDYADFGFETACQVHGNAHTLPCGCKVHIVFDHHKRAELTDADKHPFRAVAVCDQHTARRFNSVAAHYWTACRDDQEHPHLRPFLPIISSSRELDERVAERERLKEAT